MLNPSMIEDSDRKGRRYGAGEMAPMWFFSTVHISSYSDGIPFLDFIGTGHAHGK